MPELITSSKPSLRMGSGVSRSRESAERKEESARIDYVEDHDENGNAKWSLQPSMADQFIKYPKTCRKGCPKTEIFHLDNPEELKNFNNLAARTWPPGHPGITMQQQEQQYRGTWSVLVRYQEVEYKVLLKRT